MTHHRAVPHRRCYLSSRGQGGKDVSGNRNNVCSKSIRKYCWSEVLGTLLVLMGPSSPLLQHLPSFPRYLGIWRKVEDDAGKEG